MTLPMTPFLKKVLMLDAAASGAMAVLLVAGAALLAPFLGLPVALLFWAGIVLVPWTVLLAMLARHDSVSRTWLREVVLVNTAWVAASFAILLLGFVEPTMLGIAFVAAQALAVTLLTALQVSALRQAGEAAA